MAIDAVVGPGLAGKTIFRWLKRPGDHIRPGEPLFDVNEAQRFSCRIADNWCGSWRGFSLVSLAAPPGTRLGTYQTVATVEPDPPPPGTIALATEPVVISALSLSDLQRVFGSSRRSGDSLAFLRRPTSSRHVFLCYRWSDTKAETGRLYDTLVRFYGEGAVFMDVANIPLGADFLNHVREIVGRCSAALVMIGRQWLTLKDKHGRRRLDDPNDVVRAEIVAALDRHIPVIPVLVDDATMPSADELPSEIQGLTRRKGIELRHADWQAAVERLVEELDLVARAI